MNNTTTQPGIFQLSEGAALYCQHPFSERQSYKFRGTGLHLETSSSTEFVDEATVAAHPIPLPIPLWAASPLGWNEDFVIFMRHLARCLLPLPNYTDADGRRNRLVVYVR